MTIDVLPGKDAQKEGADKAVQPVVIDPYSKTCDEIREASPEGWRGVSDEEMKELTKGDIHPAR